MHKIINNIQFDEGYKNRCNELSNIIIGAAIEVHKELGPGLFESAYEECFCYELAKRNLHFERQKTLPVRYKDISLDLGYRIDVLVEDLVIVDLNQLTKSSLYIKLK